MLSDKDLFDAITNTALRGCDVNVGARKSALWDAAVCIMTDVLRNYDPFTRERLLRGLVAELRESVVRLDELLRPPSPNNLN
jgi:hypothetical protein